MLKRVSGLFAASITVLLYFGKRRKLEVWRTQVFENMYSRTCHAVVSKMNFYLLIPRRLSGHWYARASEWACWRC